MFETIVAKIANSIRNLVKSVSAATHKTPWLAPVAILAFFFVI